MTIFGLDFSHYDAVPNGARVVSEGFSFMTHKAGGDANDAELAAWWTALKPYRDKVLLGAYWVLYPGNPGGRADMFLARLDSQCPGWRDGPFILQVDCEEWNGNAATVPPKSDIKAFCDRLVSKMPKLWPIVYAPEWVYGDSLAGLGYPLWASKYVTGTGTASGLYPGDGSSKWDAYSGRVPAILQFTSSANALGQTTCDANAFRGTLDQLTALVAPGWVEDMPTADEIAAATVKMLLNTQLYDPNSPVDPNTGKRGTKAISSILAYRDYVDVGQADRVIGTLAPLITSNAQELAQQLAPLLNSVQVADLQQALVGAFLQLANPVPPAQLTAPEEDVQ
jgi:lysozyme